MRNVFLAGEEAQEGAPLLGDVVADGAAQHGIAGFESIQDGAGSNRARDVQLDISFDAREGAEMRRKHDPDHGRVCASTERTAGRSRTMGAQLSPASREA